MESIANGVATDAGIVGRAMRFCHRVAKSEYLVHNVIVLFGTLLTGFFNYLLNPVLIHLVGLAAYSKIVSLLGLLAVLLTPTQIVTFIVAKYTSALGARGEYGQLNDLVRRLIAILLPVGIGMTVVFSVASGFIATFLHLDSSQGVLIIGLAFIIAFVGPVNGGALQGLQRFSWMSGINAATPVVRVALVVVLVQLGFGFNGALLGYVLSAVVTYLVSFYPIRGLLKGPREYSGSLRPMWSYSVTAAVASACSVLLLNLDTILAGHFLGAREAGLYDGLAIIGRTALFVTASVGTVMFPKAAALHERGERTTRVVLQALLGVLALSSCAELVFLVAPGLVIRLLFHNPALLAVSGQLFWYGLAMLMLALAQTLITYFLSIGNRFFVVSVLACCILEAVLIVTRHHAIGDLLQAVVVANLLLFVALFVTFLVPARRGRQSRERLATSGEGA